MMEHELYARLRNHPTLAAIVGARVFPLVIPQGASYPCLTYQRISTPSESSLSGPSGLTYPRVQVGCWATNYSAATDLGEAVRKALSGSQLANSAAIRVLDVRQSYEPEPKLFRVDLDFEIWTNE